MNLVNIGLYIFLGGGLGSLSRFGIGKLATTMSITKFPLGTLLANLSACIILGIIIYYFKDKLVDSLFIKYFLIIGFCGGFSTFSTFSLETVQLFKDGLLFYGILNILLSISLAFIILWVLAK